MTRYTYKEDRYGDIDILCKNIYPRYEDGEDKPIAYYGQAIDRLSAYEDIGLTPEQIREVDVLFAEKCKELAEYKKSYKLPCKVGDKVYANDGEFGILEYDVDCITIDNSIIYQCSSYLQDFDELCEIEVDITDFGKTVFLTRKEAEIALKKNSTSDKK